MWPPASIPRIRYWNNVVASPPGWRLNTATTIPELEQHLTALEGPRLADRSLPPARASQPDRGPSRSSRQRLERARSSVPPTSPRTLLGEIARTSLACLALAVGCAGLAWRPGGGLSPLAKPRSAGSTCVSVRVP